MSILFAFEERFRRNLNLGRGRPVSRSSVVTKSGQGDGGSQPGDIVLVKGERGLRLRRLVVADLGREVLITRGDCGREDDPAVAGRKNCGQGDSQRRTRWTKSDQR